MNNLENLHISCFAVTQPGRLCKLSEHTSVTACGVHPVLAVRVLVLDELFDVIKVRVEVGQCDVTQLT